MRSPENQFRSNLYAARTQFGSWVMSGDALIAEAMGWAGYDFLVVDMEHGPVDVPRCLAMLQAIAGTPAAAVVRLPWNDEVLTKQVLDAGAQTLMFPFIQNAAEARRAVASTRYPPLGVRGFAGMTRATRFMKNDARSAQDLLCVVIQLETSRAIAELDDIASVDGVDCLFVGPGDLSADMGHLAEPGHEAVQAKLRDAALAIRRTGKPSGIVAPNAEQARAYLDFGYSWVAVASDLGLIMTAARSDLARLRVTFNEQEPEASSARADA